MKQNWKYIRDRKTPGFLPVEEAGSSPVRLRRREERRRAVQSCSLGVAGVEYCRSGGEGEGYCHNTLT